MPSNVVKTEHDEKLWRRAKAAYHAAVERGEKITDKWKYIMGVFQHMKQRTGSKPPPKTKAAADNTARLEKAAGLQALFRRLWRPRTIIIGSGLAATGAGAGYAGWRIGEEQGREQGIREGIEGTLYYLPVIAPDLFAPAGPALPVVVPPAQPPRQSGGTPPKRK